MKSEKCSLLSHVLTLCNPMDWSPPGSSVHGIFQARILESVAISYCRGFSRPKDQTRIPCISYTGKSILYHCTTWEAWYSGHVYWSESVSNWLTLGRKGLSLLHWLLISLIDWTALKMIVMPLGPWLPKSHLFLSFFLFYSVCQVIRRKD